MKLTIDIPEEQYNDIVKHLTDNDGNYAYSDFNLREIIRNGTPYNPSGDCISREALKEVLSKEIKTNDMGLWLKILLVIDNAQAVEFSLLPLSGEADNAYMRGYEVGKAEGILKANTRPQGKWIDESCEEDTYFRCSLCGEISCCKGNFCSDCGADMRKGGAE